MDNVIGSNLGGLLQGPSLHQNALGSTVGSTHAGDGTTAKSATVAEGGTAVETGPGVTNPDVKKLQETISALNKKLESTQTQIVFDQKRPPDQVWLNVVNKTTGQVLFEFPPEAIRHLETAAGSGSGSSVSGLVLDKRS